MMLSLAVLPLLQSLYHIIQGCLDASLVPPYADPIGTLSNRMRAFRLPMCYSLQAFDTWLSQRAFLNMAIFTVREMFARMTEVLDIYFGW